MTQDDRFEDFVRSALNELDPTPEVPREEMWARIESARRFQRPRKRTTPVWLAWAVGAAALLAVGIGLGRLSVLRQAGQPQVAVRPNEPAAPNTQLTNAGSTSGAQNEGPDRVETTQPANGSAPYRIAALQHLSRAEVLLAGVRSGTVDREVTMWANDMLASTRMLLDSPAADDPRMSQLLDDLELLLAQIAAAAPAQRNRAELDLIQQGIDQTNVLPRLRATLPANSTAAGT